MITLAALDDPGELMRSPQIGLVLGVFEDVPTGEPRRWHAIREQARFAEEVGFDTVWIPDELLWEPESWPGPRGFWECVALTAAVAETTSDIVIGTWVMSALHRNPALTAKVASTLDEISGGRLLFGFGAGHSGKQGAAFGYPPDRIVGRYEEALRIVVPLLRDGEVDFDGEHHRTTVVNRPAGPRPGRIPIMLAGHGPRTITLAVEHGDMWSAYATTSSQPEAFVEMLEMVDRACADAGRDPATLGRSIGLDVVPAGFEAPAEFGITDPLTGSADEMAQTIDEFAEMGVTSIEFMVWPNTPETLQASSEVLRLLAD